MLNAFNFFFFFFSSVDSFPTAPGLVLIFFIFEEFYLNVKYPLIQLIYNTL